MPRIRIQSYSPSTDLASRSAVWFKCCTILVKVRESKSYCAKCHGNLAPKMINNIKLLYDSCIEWSRNITSASKQEETLCTRPTFPSTIQSTILQSKSKPTPADKSLQQYSYVFCMSTFITTEQLHVYNNIYCQLYTFI